MYNLYVVSDICFFASRNQNLDGHFQQRGIVPLSALLLDQMYAVLDITLGLESVDDYLYSLVMFLVLFSIESFIGILTILTRNH